MLTWSMQDANVDAKEAAKKVDVALQVRRSCVCVKQTRSRPVSQNTSHISWCSVDKWNTIVDEMQPSVTRVCDKTLKYNTARRKISIHKTCASISFS